MKRVQLTNSRSDAKYRKQHRLILSGLLLLFAVFLLLLNQWSGFLPPRHESRAQALIGASDIDERLNFQVYKLSDEYEVGFCISPLYTHDELTVYLMNYAENKVNIQIVIRDEEGNVKAQSGLLSPGEMLETIKVQPLTNASLHIEVLAYEEVTYYSAGVLRVRTAWIEALEE